VKYRTRPPLRGSRGARGRRGPPPCGWRAPRATSARNLGRSAGPRARA